MQSHPILLIVDDEPAVVQTLQMVFAREHYEVLVSHSCSDAMKLLVDGSKIDVVITDLNMERENIGLEIARAAKRMNPPAAVVVCTGYANLDNVLASLNMHVEYLATKPTDLEELKLAVRDIISRRIAHRITVERLKDQFLAIVSHELRTPLTSLRLSLGLLANEKLGPISPETKRVLTMAVANTGRLMRLLDGILDVQRLESGVIPLQRRLCNISDLIFEACEIMRPVAEDSAITLGMHLCNVFISADPDRIVQALTNLLSNAIKFSPVNAKVTVGAQVRGDFLMVQVVDHGRGIPAEKLDLVFERFQQVDSSDAREKGGVGLGLAICRNIVLQHGGDIWAESIVGQGSTFSFTLPIAQGPANH